MPCAAEVSAGPPAQESPDGANDGDPDSNWLVEALRKAAGKDGRALWGKLGVSGRTVREWSSKGWDWSPPPKSMIAIQNSPLFSHLPLETRQRIRRETAQRILRRGIRRLDDICDAQRELALEYLAGCP